ncbi:hypothetical protein D3C73_1106200 [compost metagenome]
MNAAVLHALINFSSYRGFVLILTQRNSIIYDLGKWKPVSLPFFILRAVKITLDPVGR